MIYSKEEAELVFNIMGNIIPAQVSGQTAKLLSERFVKTFQGRESISINRNNTSISRGKQLEASVPASSISTLSTGEFVGIVADNPDELIPQKLPLFHPKQSFLNRKTIIFLSAASIICSFDQQTINIRCLTIKLDVRTIVKTIMADILNDPGKEHLLVKK